MRQLTTATGAVSLSRQYDPYGPVMSSAGTGTTAFGFTGEQTDASGLVYLRARYYAPAQGRFITRDTWPGDPMLALTLHRWLYANGNPTNLVDPTGHFGIEWDPAWNEPLVSGLVGLGAGILATLAVGSVCALTAGIGCLLLAGAAAGAASGFASTIASGLMRPEGICLEDVFVNTALGGVVGLATAGLFKWAPGAGAWAGRMLPNASALTRTAVRVGVTEGIEWLGSAGIAGWASREAGIFLRQVDADVRWGHSYASSALVQDNYVRSDQQMSQDFSSGFGLGLITHGAFRVGGALAPRPRFPVDAHRSLSTYPGMERNHLNQNAAYGVVIPRQEGLASHLEGSKNTYGTQHWEFHRVLEEFWNVYREGGALRGRQPTNADYDRALRQALRAAGRNEIEVTYEATRARNQRLQYGLLDDDFVPRIPRQAGLPPSR